MTNEPQVLERIERLHALWISLVYVYLFLLFFQPFGVNNYDPGEEITLQLVGSLAIFVSSCGVILLLNDLLIYPLIRPRRRLGVWAWFFWVYILFATSCFLVYNILGSWHDFKWSSYGEFLINFAGLLFIPALALVAYLTFRSLKNELSKAYHYRNTKTDGDELIRIPAENGKDAFIIKLNGLLFIESADNYVEVHFLENAQLKKSIFRQSLKAISEMEIHPALFRCHRSYIINLVHLQRLMGNRNKLHVRLSGTERDIPVSRSRIDSLFAKIEP